MENLGRLPLRFERNDGQAGPGVKFLSHGRGYTLFLTRDEAVLEFKKSEVRSQESEGNRLLSLVPGPRTAGERVLNTKDQGQMTKDAILSMKIAGANRSAPVAAADELSGKSNYYLGKDPKKWQTGVPNYARVQYQGIYPGIDLAYYGNQGGQLTTRSRSSSIPFWFTPPNHTAGFSLSPSGSEKIFIMRSFSEPPRAEVRAVQRRLNHPANLPSPRSAHNRILSLFPRKQNGS
jgi:hypothetical protein